jgi:Ca-activated chloride channel family protein
MTFIWPTMLLFLLCIPFLIGLYIYLQRRRRSLVASSESLMGRQIQRRQPGRRRHIPPLFFLGGLSCLLFALARPQTTVSFPRVEGTVILAFDVSGSMAADDLQPSRMEAAKASAIEFVQSQPTSVQIGVVAFSEGGLSVQAPTNDQDAILASINRLKPERGTSLGYGILTALNTISADLNDPENNEALPTPAPVPEGTYGPSIIVLLSDGENTAPPDPFEAAYTAAEQGVRIYSIGIGSPTGATLNVNGFMVHTQLNEVALEQIAGLTGGEYYNAASVEDMRGIYENISPELVIKPEKMEITSMFAGSSILFLLFGGWLMLTWFGRLP